MPEELFFKQLFMKGKYKSFKLLYQILSEVIGKWNNQFRNYL